MSDEKKDGWSDNEATQHFERAGENEIAGLKARPKIVPGTILNNRYLVDKRLGGGGMGDVFKALDTVQDHEFVAIKQMTDSDEDSVRRFRREYELLKKVDYPNLLKAYDCFEQDGVLFMVLEYVHGQSMEQMLAGPRNLSLPHQLVIANKVTRATEILHEAGVIHRDIKPSNIMLDPPRNLVKLLDLGAGKDVWSEAKITQAGMCIGTAEYMSPEHANGEPTEASDVFSLGVTLYQFFAWLDKSPFAAGTHFTTLVRATEYNPPPLSEIIKAEFEKQGRILSPREEQAYESLSRAVAKAMEKDPARRYKQLGTLADELAEIYGMAMGMSAEPQKAKSPEAADLSPRLDKKLKSTLQQMKMQDRKASRLAQWKAACAKRSREGILPRIARRASLLGTEILDFIRYSLWPKVAGEFAFVRESLWPAVQVYLEESLWPRMRRTGLRIRESVIPQAAFFAKKHPVLLSAGALLLAALLVAVFWPEPPEWRVRGQEARKLLEQGDSRAAASLIGYGRDGEPEEIRRLREEIRRRLLALARESLDRCEFQAAADHLDFAGSSPAALAIRARTLAGLGKDVEGREVLKRIESANLNGESRELAAHAALLVGWPEKAREFLDSNADSPALQKLLARCQMALGDYASAQALYHAVDQQGFDPEASLGLARLDFHERRYREAATYVQDLQRVMTELPSALRAELFFLDARILWAELEKDLLKWTWLARQDRGCLEALERIQSRLLRALSFLEEDRSSSAAGDLLADIRLYLDAWEVERTCDPEKRKSAPPAWKEGEIPAEHELFLLKVEIRRKIRDEMWREAHLLCHLAIARFPWEERLYYLRSVARFHLGVFPQSASDLEKCVQISRGDFSTFSNLETIAFARMTQEEFSDFFLLFLNRFRFQEFTSIERKVMEWHLRDLRRPSGRENAESPEKEPRTREDFRQILIRHALFRPQRDALAVFRTGDRGKRLLEEILRDPSENPAMRLLAARMSAELCDTESFWTLLKMSQGDSFPLNFLAAKALDEAELPIDFPRVSCEQIYKTSGEPATEEFYRIFVALSPCRIEADLAVRLLQDRSELVAACAVNGLRRRRNLPMEWRREKLETRAIELSQTPNPEIRALACQGLWAFSGDEEKELRAGCWMRNHERLLQSLQDKERVVRESAVLSIIEDCYRMEKEDRVEVRRAQVMNVPSFPKVLDSLRSLQDDPAFSLRLWSVIALSALDNPGYIRSIVDDPRRSFLVRLICARSAFLSKKINALESVKFLMNQLNKENRNPEDVYFAQLLLLYTSWSASSMPQMATFIESLWEKGMIDGNLALKSSSVASTLWGGNIRHLKILREYTASEDLHLRRAAAASLAALTLKHQKRKVPELQAFLASCPPEVRQAAAHGYYEWLRSNVRNCPWAYGNQETEEAYESYLGELRTEMEKADPNSLQTMRFAMESAAALAPHSKYHHEAALACLHLGLYPEAEAHALRSAELSVQEREDLGMDGFRQEIRSLISIGEIYLQSGREEDARKIFEDAITRFPLESRGYLFMGQICERRRDEAKARDFYLRAYLKNPSAYMPTIFLAASLLKTGETEQAIRILQHARRWFDMRRHDFENPMFAPLKGHPWVNSLPD